MTNYLEKIKHWWRKLPDRKPYIEFITALLSIPVLLTVILLNVGNLRQNEKKEETENKTAPVVVTITQEKKTEDEKPTPTPTKECEPVIGDTAISYPVENATIEDNPVQFAISYKKGKTCSVVWSYRINGERWSDYDDKSISIYNLPNGKIKFELRVKSVVGGEEKLLERNFNYTGGTVSPTATLTPTPVVTTTQ